MIYYKLFRQVALALRWVQDNAEYNAETFAVIAKRSAHKTLDKEADKAADVYHAAQEAAEALFVSYQQALSKVEDSIDEYTALVNEHVDIRHDIEIEVI
jgi:hypothetical protein